jgi:hypothetical protein
MSAPRVGLFALMAAAAPLAVAQQQGATVLQVHVTSASGRFVYLDTGRDAGVAPGQIVRLFVPGAVEVQATVRAVSATSSRAELPPGVASPPVGCRGEIEVARSQSSSSSSSASRPGGATSPGSVRPTPAHPPWKRTLDPRDPNQPLLVPTFGQRADERPVTWDGRTFLNTQWSRDVGGERDNEYWLTRMGVAGEANNLLGHGERTRFAGEFDDRRAEVDGDGDTDDSKFRVDQLSTQFGTEKWSPYGAEAGRFLSQHLPEIGLVDGVEGVARYQNGFRLGAGAGSYPLPFPSRNSGDDLGLHLFADYVSDEKRSFAAAVGLQKTWHRGAPDRDMMLLRVEHRPAEGWSLFGSAKLDWYTSGDERKGSGIGLTELLAQARYDEMAYGVGLQASHFEWPDLKRAEYVVLPDSLVRDGKLDRLSWNGWLRVHEDVRLTARFDNWMDEDESGTAWELGADWNDVFETGTSVTAQVFQTNGGAQSGPGLRLLARKTIGEVWLNAGYRWYGYEIEGLLAGPESYTRQSIEFGAAWGVGDWDLNLQVERWFGDQEDAYAIALYAQWRF